MIRLKTAVAAAQGALDAERQAAEEKRRKQLEEDIQWKQKFEEYIDTRIRNAFERGLFSAEINLETARLDNDKARITPSPVAMDVLKRYLSEGYKLSSWLPAPNPSASEVYATISWGHENG